MVEMALDGPYLEHTICSLGFLESTLTRFCSQLSLLVGMVKQKNTSEPFKE